MPSETASPQAWTANLAEAAGSIMQVDELNGVPAVFASTDEPGLFAALLFRVGYADEQFSNSGITHLIEHLALQGMLTSEVHANGMVSERFTIFHCHGDAEEVNEFLRTVTASLSDLPLARAEQEKRVLAVEWQGRQGHPAQNHAFERYGHRGPGLVFAGEPGLNRVGEPEIAAWAAKYFNAQNAVLVYTADELPSESPLHLPKGSRAASPQRAWTVPSLPGYYPFAGSHLRVDAELPRGAAGALFVDVAQRALMRRLRERAGITYSVGADYSPVDARYARLTLTADASADQLDRLTDEFFDTLEGMRDGDVDLEDLTAEKRNRLRVLQDHKSIGMMMALAQNVMMGQQPPTADELRAEVTAVTTADLSTVASSFLEHAFAQLPGGTLERRGFRLSPRWSSRVVSGAAHRLVDDSDAVLQISADGVSYIAAPGAAVTVLFEDCVGLMSYPDGGRILVGADGFSVRIEPTVTRGLTEQKQVELDAMIPAGRHVPMPPRAPEGIPKPVRRPIRRIVRASRGPLTVALPLIGLAVLIVGVWLAGRWLDVPVSPFVLIAPTLGVFLAMLARSGRGDEFDGSALRRRDRRHRGGDPPRP